MGSYALTICLKIILDVKITYHLLKILNTEGTWQDFVYISAHKLYIETGRYLGILRYDRICTQCSINEVEDEQHYLFTCPGMESKRKILYDTIEKSCINFKHLNNKNKLIWLLNTEDKNILLELCKFLCLI